MKSTFSSFTIFVTILALILGNLVVATNSGDACGSDWPICNGRVIPDFSNYRVLIEYSHRLFTTVLGVIIVVNSILSWKKTDKPIVKMFSILTLCLLFIQALVGGLNVLLGTPTGFTTLDVMFSLFLLVSLIFLHGGLVTDPHDENKHRLSRPLLIALLLLLVEILIGAVFKHFEISSQLFRDGSIQYDFLYFTYFVHGILGLSILFFFSNILFSSFKWKVFRRESSLLVFFTLVTTAVGFITKTEDLSPLTSSIHMILTIISLAILSYMGAVSLFSKDQK